MINVRVQDAISFRQFFKVLLDGVIATRRVPNHIVGCCNVHCSFRCGYMFVLSRLRQQKEIS